MKGQNKLFISIIAALVLGVIIGAIVHFNYPKDTIDTFSKNIKLLGSLFIRLVQMIIAPLVFSTLVVGIAKMGDMKMVGRVGAKAMTWFITASLTSLLIGLVLVNIMKPGEGTDIVMNVSDAGDLLKTQSDFTLE
ncbi:dicarboxylate/amino acid:cation symporter, partial [Elizabethkingia meningoseptica]